MKSLITCFHGSDSEIEEFIASERGSIGAGIYFAECERSASAYGEQITAASVTLSNPWIIDLDYESERAFEEDFDSPCVDAVLSLPNGREMLESAKAADGKYGKELQDAIKALGHDGIIGTYPDGSQEIVAFSPHQVSIQNTQAIRKSASPMV